ncbi:MAG: hypothetical protein J7623_29845 [Chitinophaga sp.]|uniref:hypothetical protein n=1 Tax=Chitinophaga sp. TaxID=1869181 RepID=UPI001B1C3DE1|nr:hypothetical protein [Chitinophaga sp.]MBO9732884.1 hypothetical protein [Chitinophaga sp.]
MRKLFSVLFVCCLSCITVTSFAQDDVRTWSLAENDTRYIFADTAFVRISTDTKQAPIDTLLTGEEITVVKITDKLLNLKGLTAPWIQVKYKKDGVDKEGYLWQGLISFRQVRRGDTKFIYAIDRRMDSTVVADDGVKMVMKYFLVKLKVVQAGQLKAVNSFKIFDGESANFGDAKIMSGLGLSNVQNIVVLTFGGEACGIESNYFYFAWLNDSRLVPLPARMSVGDAGAYYHDESFTFPAEKNGQPDIIRWDLVEGEATEKMDKNGEPVFKETKSTFNYSWDGVNGTFKRAESGKQKAKSY